MQKQRAHESPTVARGSQNCCRGKKGYNKSTFMKVNATWLPTDLIPILHCCGYSTLLLCCENNDRKYVNEWAYSYAAKTDSQLKLAFGL